MHNEAGKTNQNNQKSVKGEKNNKNKTKNKKSSIEQEKLDISHKKFEKNVNNNKN